MQSRLKHLRRGDSAIARLAALGGTDEGVRPHTGIGHMAPGFAQAWTAEAAVATQAKKAAAESRTLE